MEMRKVPYEDSYSHWVSEGIVGFFDDLGYRVFHDTVGQPNEAIVPLDRVYTVSPPDGPVYLFALQMKAPEGRRTVSWRLVRHQHDDQFRLIREHHSDWIWYCLPYFRKATWHKAALDLSHFARATRFCETARTVLQVPGNFLVSVPACGPHCPWCHELMHFCRHEPCGDHHDDPDLRRLGRLLHQWARRGTPEVECLCAFSSPDSWGTFVSKMLSRQVGRVIASQDDLRVFLDEHLTRDLLTESAVVAAVSVITGAVSIVSGFAGQPQENQQDEYPPFDDEVEDWPL